MAQADAIYWFADFQDKVDAGMMADVVKRMKARKQKLYIHATVKGRSFEQVKEGMVIPTGGELSKWNCRRSSVEKQPQKLRCQAHQHRDDPVMQRHPCQASIQEAA